ncbi:MAG: hypothetical protein QNL62_22140 [Gammaproteobacteria bacterium]|nr:hypothetical protein [Gammaproteobacteria bacterium]
MGFKSVLGAKNLGAKKVIISTMFVAFTPVFISSAFAATDTDGDGV